MSGLFGLLRSGTFGFSPGSFLAEGGFIIGFIIMMITVSVIAWLVKKNLPTRKVMGDVTMSNGEVIAEQDVLDLIKKTEESAELLDQQNKIIEGKMGNHCQNCGGLLKTNAKFCGSCGNPVL